jgi:hypothetical protein
LHPASSDTDGVKTPERRAAVRKQPYARSRVGNGKALLAGIDQRSLAYREYQDTVADLVHHLGNLPTVTEQAMVEEAAGLIVWCRQERLKLLQGLKFEIGPYTTAVNSLRRLLVDLGLEARLHDVTPSLDAYMRRKAFEAATDAEIA